MKLCKHCEVEVEQGMHYCPLCRNPLQPGVADEVRETTSPFVDAREATRHVRRWILEILSLLAVTGAVVIFAADFAPDLRLTWGRYALAAIAFAWLSAILGMYCSHRAWVYLPAEVAGACLFLFALDRFAPGPSWFLPLALPVTLLIGTTLALTLTVVRKAGLTAVGSVGVALLAAGVSTVGLELLINRYRDDRWFISWSAVAFLCLLPLVSLLLYLQRWLRTRQGEIRKIFHL